MDGRAGLRRRLSAKELMVSICGAGEDSWEFLGLQGDQTSQSKENQPWIFIGRTYAEAPILWPPGVKNWLIGKDPDAGKDWRQEEKGTTKDEMFGWFHQLNGHEFEQFGGGQESLACCSSWGRRVGHDWATELNWMMLGRVVGYMVFLERTWT